ncbi:D-galactoside/L-rhamnose binding SUEL lectin domain-containing protein [Cynara cardunculus var. scolymus]|uniref:beta-galactosidase n=1 Tax=Cynara cardunculus var. scolymus TaxID=59895 RepID=A0A118JU05_CYNCS|nr:D-galactoside/L-rhamnose binding SUEL lectin domain-containing protein [Cynara cardunculus var. scolymus]
MASTVCTLLLFFFSCFVCLYISPFVAAVNNVTYDSRSLIINGERKLLISAAIHYPRSVPAMWPGLVKTAKEGGVDVIETYVFWNGHEPSPGNYYFGGRYDLPKFVKIVQEAGMLLILRIGPFVAAEWNFGSKKMVENEYGYYEAAYGEGGKAYTQWAAKMALSQNTGVPWIMCQQWDAPDPVINTCNSFYCDDFKPSFATMPKIWTENWPGWFKTFGGRDPHRPAEDVAYSVARFFQKGGSAHNYYMYHGGTNFGRTSGGPFITTSYDYDAPIDEYGLPRFPKWGHLKELHRAIKLCEHALLNNKPTLVHLGPLQEADVYEDQSGSCAAFIANLDDKSEKTVGSQTSTIEMEPEQLKPSIASPDKDLKPLSWEIFVEKAGIWGEADFTPSAAGNGTVSPFKFKSPVSLKAGKNEIAILSMTVGLQNAGSFYEWVGAGLTSVKLKGSKNGTMDLSNSTWTYKIGLEGEHLGLYDANGLKNVNWRSAVVDAPPGDEPVALDMVHMGKGLAWLNGEQIGRYWPRKAPIDKCVKACDYRGKFNPDKCNTGCGEPTQRWSWFKPSGNVLVMFEEKGGDPTQIRFSRRKLSGLCAHISEDHPSFLCLNKNECKVGLTEKNFRTEICPGVMKKLAVEAMCS